jgi:hypothetical protein
MAAKYLAQAPASLTFVEARLRSLQKRRLESEAAGYDSESERQPGMIGSMTANSGISQDAANLIPSTPRRSIEL